MSLPAVVSNLTGDLLTVTLWMSSPTESKETLRSVVAKNGKRMRDVADDLALVEVKSKRDPGVLEVVVAGAGIRLIGLELNRGDDQGEPDGHTENRLAASIDGTRR